MTSGSWSGLLSRARARPSLATHRIDGYRLRAHEGVAIEDLRAVSRELLETTPEGRVLLGQRQSAFVAELPKAGPVVVKEYLRGGLVRHLVTRTHLWRPRTRPDHEFRMLVRAAAAGARVPQPIATAARGRLLYRGWLVTRLVPGARSLLDVCGGSAAAVEDLLRDVGRQISCLIGCGILHSDLHPGNVIVNADGEACLLDFDRAVVFPGPPRLMRRVYRARWRAAVKRHRLPHALGALPSFILDAR